MKVKIVTDSTSEISPEQAKNLGIEIVPELNSRDSLECLGVLRSYDNGMQRE